MSKVDPSDYIITRKRKKYRFALFANNELCFEFDEWDAREVDAIELGAGTGFFSVELARQNPDKTYVAVDVKGDRLQKGAARATELGLTNVLFLRARADQLRECFRAAKEIWLTFPDPFPKKRSAGRRMTHLNFLALYAEVLERDGHFYLKHDNQQFFHWSLEQLVAAGWKLEELSFDLHESELDDTYKITTTYEERWLGEGLTTNFVKAKRG